MTHDEQERDWLNRRFDKIDYDNHEIKEENKKIKEKIQTIHDKVTTHGVYWSFVKWGAISVAGSLGSILAWFGFTTHKH